MTSTMTNEQAVRELCDSLCFNYKYALAGVRKYGVDAIAFLRRLDREESMMERLKVGEEFLTAIRPF